LPFSHGLLFLLVSTLVELFHIYSDFSKIPGFLFSLTKIAFLVEYRGSLLKGVLSGIHAVRSYAGIAADEIYDAVGKIGLALAST
jgi:hypothetical protein